MQKGLRIALALLALLLPLSACERADDPEVGRTFEWHSSDPEDAGFDPDELDRIQEDARKAGSTCFMVVRDGRVVAESYWHTGRPDKPVPAFSVTKSVTSTLVGIAQADGDLDIDDRVSKYVPEWRGTPSEKVTIRHLLSNDSGRRYSPTDFNELVRVADQTSYAVEQPQASPPGKVWEYNNTAIQVLDRVLREATGTDTAEYAEKRLFEPLGMEDTRMTGDKSGKSTTMAFGLESTCRDLARFGQLFADGGTWLGKEIVPESWIKQATGEASQRLNPSYGLLWWVNSSGKLVPDADRDVYAAIGFGGQIVLVDPRSDTLVVRLGIWGSSYNVVQAGAVVTKALRSAR